MAILTATIIVDAPVVLIAEEVIDPLPPPDVEALSVRATRAIAMDAPYGLGQREYARGVNGDVEGLSVEYGDVRWSVIQGGETDQILVGRCVVHRVHRNDRQ